MQEVDTVQAPRIAHDLSVFSVSRDRDGSRSERENSDRQDSASRERPLILVVDDEPIVRETLLAILSDEGYQVASAADGLAAVQETIRLEPDIVVLDVAMPRLNGVEAAKQILSSVPGIRILLFSGQAETADLLLQAREAGYEFEILAKPVKPQTLIRALRTPWKK
jgi:CheY-like chemotaxis protein